MANEITYKVSLSVSKGGAAIDSGTISDTVTMTGTDMQTATQLVGYHATTAEALSFNSTDINGNVHFVITVLGDYPVKVSTLATFSSDSIISYLQPGESASFRGIDCEKIFLVATTASFDSLVQFWICEV